MPTPQQHLGAALILQLMALPGAALADLTARGLWADWQSAAEAQGLSITAEAVTETADGLRLTGVTTVSGESDGATVTATVPLVTLRETGNGEVALAFPEGKRVSIAEPAEGTAPTVVFIDSSSLTMTASGTPEATDYAWTAPAMAITLESFDPGEPPVAGTLAMQMRDLSGRLTGYDRQLDGPVTTVLEAAEMGWTLGVDDTAAGATTAIEGRQEAIVFQTEAINAGTGGVPLADGSIRVALDAGAGTSMTRQTYEGATRVSQTSHESVDFRADIDPDSAFYTVAAAGLAARAEDPAMPVSPIALTLDEIDIALAGPIAESDAPQPFDVTLALIGLTPDEALWAALDPSGALPRRPLTLNADISGKALLGPAAATGLPAPSGPDFAPTELTVNRLDLSYGEAGAEARGAFSLPRPTGLAAPGMPQPVGTLDVILRGIPGLLAQLSASGLVPQEQMMGVQMMLGMFAAPQPDGTMTTRIETREDGSLFVNGNQLR